MLAIIGIHLTYNISLDTLHKNIFYDFFGNHRICFDETYQVICYMEKGFQLILISMQFLRGLIVNSSKLQALAAANNVICLEYWNYIDYR